MFARKEVEKLESEKALGVIKSKRILIAFLVVGVLIAIVMGLWLRDSRSLDGVWQGQWRPGGITNNEQLTIRGRDFIWQSPRVDGVVEDRGTITISRNQITFHHVSGSSFDRGRRADVFEFSLNDDYLMLDRMSFRRIRR